MNKTFVIEKGEYISADTIKVCHGGFDAILEGGPKTYVLPISVTSFTGEATRSEKATLYLLYNAKELFSKVVATAVGTEITEKTNWTCTSSTGVSVPEAVNANTNDYAWVHQSGSFVNGLESMVIDMGSVQQVRTFGMYYYAWYYASDQITLEYSVDGVTYLPAGDNGGLYINPADYAQFNIMFYAPLEARYFRVNNGTKPSYSNNYGTVLKEVRVYVW